MEEETSTSFTLYHVISSAFCVIVVLSNMISAKMVTFPLLGMDFPVGMVIYPFTFLLSAIVTELFGVSFAKRMVYTALSMNLLGLGIIELALLLPAANGETEVAFQVVMGLSGLRIFSSLTAYFISQIIDIQVYAWIKKWTGPRFLWLRNNGATCLSQMVDTVVLDMIYLYWGLSMGMDQVVPIMIFSYLYKAFFSLASTPLFYLCIFTLQKTKSTFNVSFALQSRTY